MPHDWWSFGGHLVVLSGTRWVSLGIVGSLSPSAARSSGESGHAAISAVGLPAAPPPDLSTFPPAKVPTKPPTNLPNARGMLQREIPASQAAFRLAPRA